MPRLNQGGRVDFLSLLQAREIRISCAWRMSVALLKSA